MWKFSFCTLQTTSYFVLFIILNLISQYSCASWCSWSNTQYLKMAANAKCVYYRSRLCECPAAIGTSNTCVGPAEQISTSSYDCTLYPAVVYKPLLSGSPWCQWNLWSPWNSLNICVNDLNVQQRVRKRECNCATSWSQNNCPTSFSLQYSNQSITSATCDSLNWCEWSEWKGCPSICPTTATQSRSTTCGCSSDQALNNQCLIGNWTSIETRSCLSSFCYNGTTVNTNSTSSVSSSLFGALIIACLSVVLLALIGIVIYIRIKRMFQHKTTVDRNCSHQTIELDPQNIALGHINDCFDLDFAPPPFSELVAASDLPPPSYDTNEYLAPPPFCEINERSMNVPSAPPSYDEWLETQTVELNT